MRKDLKLINRNKFRRNAEISHIDANVAGTTIHGIEQSQLPVFLQGWWLSAARGALNMPHREAKVIRAGQVVGYLAYTMKRNRVGIRSWEPLDWCRVNEPILSPNLSACEKANVLSDLIGQLPRNISFEFVCGPSAIDLPLITEIASAAGFAQRLETIFWQSPEASRTVMERVGRKYRQGINKAREELAFVELNADQFIELYDKNLQAARRRPYSDSGVARSLISAGLTRHPAQVRIIAVRKKTAPADTASIDAAIACVWDSQRFYYWMTTCSRFIGNDRDQKAHTHAVKFLVTTAMQDAGERGLVFDSDGGHTEGAAKQFADLKFEHKAERIVFTRHTLPLRLYNMATPLIKSMVYRLRNSFAGSKRTAATPNTQRRHAGI